MLRAAFAGLWLSVACTAGAQTLTLHFQERPPYSSRATDGDGSVWGLVASPAASALRDADVPYQWALTPSQRQLALIQSGSGRHCGVGWFRTAERETQGKFSRPLYRDRPLGALVRAETSVASSTTSSALTRSRNYRLLVKEGYSYGAQLDEQIARAALAPITTAADPPQMARMLLAGRADWMIVAHEEAAQLVEPGLRLVEFSDLGAGLTRHLYCSRDVPDDWLIRIDRALSALVK